MPSRWSKLCSVLPITLVGALVGACGATPLRTQKQPQAASSAEPNSVEPVAELPRARDVAAGGDGAVTLRTPIARDSAKALVAKLFEAIHARNFADLESELEDSLLYPLVDRDPARESPRATLVYTINTVLRGAPYHEVDIDTMYRPQDLEVYGPDELGAPGRPAKVAGMRADDVLVRIPITTPRVGADVLFYDELRVVLRRQGSKYRLKGISEIAPR